MNEPHRGAHSLGLERYYVLTGGRSKPAGAGALDVATLVAARTPPAPGMQHEHAAILRWCRAPLSVAEIGAHLGLPFNIIAVLVADLLKKGHVESRDPLSGAEGHGPGLALLEEVLSGLQRL
ncbi:DUF742 domain-containing protein [Streptomyces sp. ODS28]|uniref:DUF742 domain-containing protein n=1 Tax=Streptomyces sp. ODS28 TaxID=3136688 RepID=UPI0031E88670